MVWGARAPLSLAIAVGPVVDPEIWWVVPKDNPFSTGPVVFRWGRVWWVAWAGLSPVSHLVTFEAGAWRVRSHMGGLRLVSQRG